MCGFVGIANTSAVANREWLAIGCDTLIHRGPDGSGQWWSPDGRIGLGHRRLAILELSSLGQQPMHDHAKGLSIVFNGEIYNHVALRDELIAQGFVFRSHCDTEVLLAAYAAWGESCLTRLNGMFAFALYDARKQSLFIARDRAGEKPLFYRLANNSLQFASELKALLANPDAPRNIAPESLDCYLGMGFIPGNRCILQGYNKLPPAHALSFSLISGESKTWRYWSLPELPLNVAHGKNDEGKLLDELETLLEDSVGLQLEADVPVGVLLSGGVDSSLITAMAVRRSSKVHTFTVGFPGYGKLDETDHARLIARHFGTEHSELMVDKIDAALISTLATQFDEPMVDSSMIPTWLVTNLVSRHCKVALGGDGGDELFGGYPYYCRLIWLNRWLASIPKFVRRNVSAIAESWLPSGTKGRNYMQAISADFRKELPLSIIGMFDSITRAKLMKKYPEYKLVAENVQSSMTPAQADILQRATRMDFNNYLAEDLLVKVDRTSMHNSLEVRAPFLDYRLIEFAYGKVPSQLKATINKKKFLLKRLAARVLPAEFDLQRKQGFSIPLDKWLKEGAFMDLFYDILTSSDCTFNRDAINSLLKGQQRGLRNGERLFALALFEMWRKFYRAS